MQRNPQHPEWAVKFRRPGTELRCIKGHYRLYECHCKYDKETKKHRKVTGKYLGSITEREGFKPSKKRLLEAELEKLNRGEAMELPTPKVGEIKEYGLSQIIDSSMNEINDRLKKDFPNDFNRIVALAYSRLRYQSPMRDVQADFSDSCLSTKTGTAGLVPSQISGFLHDLGSRRSEVVQAIDVFNTNLDADSTYMQSPESLEAYTFINFVALQWYYIIREKLRAAGKLTKYSPMQMVKYLSRFRGVYVDGKWTPGEMTKKQLALMAELGWNIT